MAKQPVKAKAATKPTADDPYGDKAWMDAGRPGPRPSTAAKAAERAAAFPDDEPQQHEDPPESDAGEELLVGGLTRSEQAAHLPLRVQEDELARRQEVMSPTERMKVRFHPNPPLCTPDKFRAVCVTLSQTGQCLYSCEANGLKEGTVNAFKNRLEAAGEPWARELWDASKQAYAELIDQVHHDRAVHGWLEPQFGKDGLLGYKRVYDNKLLSERQRAHNPAYTAAGPIELRPLTEAGSELIASLSRKAQREIKAIILRDLAEQAEARNKASAEVEELADMRDVTPEKASA